jgi:DNA polymerase IIIc chi subunit
MTSDQLPARVVLFQVRQPNLKVMKLVQTANAHFEKKEPLLIVVEDEKTMLYVDELLWKEPPTSFLPHVVADNDTPAFVAITKSRANVNQAKFAFNLCPTPLLIEGIRLIYDFEDLTSPLKQQLSSVRFDAYKKAGCLIEAR